MRAIRWCGYNVRTISSCDCLVCPVPAGSTIATRTKLVGMAKESGHDLRRTDAEDALAAGLVSQVMPLDRLHEALA